MSSSLNSRLQTTQRLPACNSCKIRLAVIGFTDSPVSVLVMGVTVPDYSAVRLRGQGKEMTQPLRLPLRLSSKPPRLNTVPRATNSFLTVDG